ncbi:hypothetical protein A2635_04320 [Candidatus Peribacteria bacterium RIFCSPHIGHO2_01_FULL_51_9]|nr:MAG: hypothetical protein A2635_04320 [Candidatus Peribacteria bacterium RIFCSPHIGHO2_01_FULL_51_9]
MFFTTFGSAAIAGRSISVITSLVPLSYSVTTDRQKTTILACIGIDAVSIVTFFPLIHNRVTAE